MKKTIGLIALLVLMMGLVGCNGETVNIDFPFEVGDVENIEVYRYAGVPVSAEKKVVVAENGKTSDKKYKRLPIAAIKGYVKAVNKMRAATRIEDIMRDHGLRYERLHGDRKDQESVRCNDVWRLIFQSSPADGSIIITEIELIEISHHYD